MSSGGDTAVEPSEHGTLPPPNPRVRRFLRAASAAFVIAFVVFVASGSGSEAVRGRVGGDYPAFYAAGQMVLDEPDQLYDHELQSVRQDELFGTEDEGFLYFAYPPYVALVYSPLAELPYRLSYAVHTVVMGGLVVVALWRLRPLLPVVDRYFEESVMLSLIFFPMMRAVTGGQTTALVFALLAIGVRALADRRDWVAGFAFAGLLFKPQYALALLGVSLLIGRWRAALAGALGAGVLYLAGAATMGWGWLGPWLEQAQWFTEIDAEVNAPNAISWLGVAEAVLGVGDPVAAVIGWGLAGLTAALLARWWWSDRGVHLGPLLALTCPAILLLAPHAMFYDAGLLVVTMAVLLAVPGIRAGGVVALYAAAYTQPLAEEIGVAPTFFITVALFVWAVSVLVDHPLRHPSVRMRAP